MAMVFASLVNAPHHLLSKLIVGFDSLHYYCGCCYCCYYCGSSCCSYCCSTATATATAAGAAAAAATSTKATAIISATATADSAAVLALHFNCYCYCNFSTSPSAKNNCLASAVQRLQALPEQKPRPSNRRLVSTRVALFWSYKLGTRRHVARMMQEPHRNAERPCGNFVKRVLGYWTLSL